MSDAPTRHVVLIVEDEALVRMTAVEMVEEADFEVLEATNADDLLLEGRRDITVVFTDIEMPGSMDGLRLAQAVRGRWPPIKISRPRAVTSCVRAICRPAGCSCQNLIAQPRFPAPYGTSRPRPRTRPWAKRYVAAKKIRRPLETGMTFSSFWHAAKAVRAPLGGSAETGAGGVRRLLVPILLNGGFGYENYLRFCSPLAVDHRL